MGAFHIDLQHPEAMAQSCTLSQHIATPASIRLVADWGEVFFSLSLSPFLICKLGLLSRRAYV